MVFFCALMASIEFQREKEEFQREMEEFQREKEAFQRKVHFLSERLGWMKNPYKIYWETVYMEVKKEVNRDASWECADDFCRSAEIDRRVTVRWNALSDDEKALYKLV
jgi:hypothetical protein